MTTNSLSRGIKASGYAVVAIIIFGIIRHLSGKDLIGGTFFKSEFLGTAFGESGVYSGWPISHLLLHLYLGFYCPDLWMLWIALGVLWEIVEWAVGEQLKNPEKASDAATRVGKIFFPQFGEKDDEITQYDNQWVRGNMSDILFNCIGLFIGVAARNLYDSRKNLTVSDYRGKISAVA
tara:strand:+ start:9043 stop:9576 length:534 start_codon:yes stop_codon:yes gene_type:complete